MIILFGVASSLKAQEVQKLEGEAYLGITLPLGAFHDGSPIMGPAFGLEMRYNLPDPHFDAGVRLSISTSVYKFKNISRGNITEYNNQSNRSVALLAVGDYNFRPLNTVNPFIGFGIGASSNDAICEVVYDHQSDSGIILLRGGVEVWQRLRVGGNVTLAERGFNSAGLTIGYVFGGRIKK